MRDGAVAGFKYFALKGTEKEIAVTVRGRGALQLVIDTPDGSIAGSVECDSPEWTEKRMDISVKEGVHALYFRVKEGRLDFAEFAF